MTRTISTTLFVGLLFVGLAGCRSPLQTLIRGQSPDVYRAEYAQDAGVPQNQVVYAGTYDNACQCDACQAERHGHFGRLFGGGGHSKHNSRDALHYDFTPPRGIVYPPRNQPAGVVFYPYYTVRGPTDFFYTGH